MRLSRRQFAAAALAGGSLAAIAPQALAKESLPDWQIGFRNAPAEGFRPSVMERIAGRAPLGLDGTLYRNGPAHFRYGSDYQGHWFDGDGMVQRIRVEAGHAVHSGHFIATPKRVAEQAAGRFLAPGFGTAGDPDYGVMSPDDVSAANTSILPLGGKMYALWEAGSAMEFDGESLETLGPKHWRDDLKGMPFLAHPKVEPGGRVWNLAVANRKVGIYDIAPTGQLERFAMMDMPMASYVHDWAMTDRHLLILCQPWVMTRNRPPFVNSLEWQPENGLVVLVVSKADLEVKRSVQCPPRAFFHTGSAFEEADGTIRLDAAFYGEPVLGAGGGTDLMRGKYDDEDDLKSQFAQLVLPPSGDGDLIPSGGEGEFPQIHPAFSGQDHSLTVYASGSAPGRPIATGLTLTDWKAGRNESFDFGAHQMVEEHLFVPKPGGTTERDAWIVGTTLNIRAQASELHVFDAARISDGPMVSWRARHAWPLGFHGAFVSA